MVVLFQKFVTWPRGLRLACACYLASVSIPEPDTEMPWVTKAPKHKDPLKWFVMACSRLSHIGKGLLSILYWHNRVCVHVKFIIAYYMIFSVCPPCSPQGSSKILNDLSRSPEIIEELARIKLI